MGAQQKRSSDKVEDKFLFYPFLFYPLIRLCLISLNLLNIYPNPLDIALYIDRVSFGFLDLPLSPWFPANKINLAKSNLVGLDLWWSSANQIYP